MTSQWLDAMKAVRRRLMSALEMLLFAAVLTLLVLVMLQVLTRYVFHVSVPWTEEVARMVLIWMVMIGASIAADRGEQYAITFLSARLTGAARLVVLITTNVLGLVFLAVFVVYGTQYVYMNLHTVNVATQVSKGVVYAALPVGAAIMCLSLLSQTLEIWFRRDAVRSVPNGGAISMDV